MSKQKRGSVKKAKRTVVDVVVHVYASFNNTIVTVTDVKGNVLCWATAGGCGFSGARKSTPYAAQMAAQKAVIQAKENYGAESASVKIDGPGPGREAAARAVGASGLSVVTVYDTTSIPFNGCRPEKERRV
jgi:small subunit ribosomal protein S11